MSSMQNVGYWQEILDAFCFGISFLDFSNIPICIFWYQIPVAELHTRPHGSNSTWHLTHHKNQSTSPIIILNFAENNAKTNAEQTLHWKQEICSY